MADQSVDIGPLTEEVTALLGDAPLMHYIGGEWVPSRDGRVGDVVNPSDATVATTVAMGGEAEVDAAARAAAAAAPAWSAMPVRDRGVLLHRLADRMERALTTLAQLEALDVGKPLADAESFDVPFAIEGIRYYADLAQHVAMDRAIPLPHIEARTRLAPYGACGFIFPWNYPLDLLVAGIAPALAAGNTVVVKPSELTPLTTLYLCRLAEEVGLPPGTINVVVGRGSEVGAPLPAHPLIQRMSFTGSTEVGRKVGAACGARPIPCKLELGGKGAAVVFDDIDVGATAEALARAITGNAGQVCCTATRWIVHEDVHDDFLAAVTARLSAVKIGPALDRTTEMGPLVSRAQLERVLDYRRVGEQQGARVVFDGGATSVGGGVGFYVRPFLLAGTEDNVCFREEIFGPAAYMTTFTDQEAAIAAVNSVDYGLANSVWTADTERAAIVAERMVAGNSWINAHNVFAYGLPYGGVHLSGMGGGVYGANTLDDYLRHQTIARPLD